MLSFNAGGILKNKWVDYQIDGENYRGYLAYDEKTIKPKPLVIIAHAWKGQDEFARQKADFLSELGFIGFAADLYGEGKCVDSNEEAENLMKPLFVDRKELRNRIVGAYKTASSQELVDSSKIGAMGFCFGGLATLELLRSGVSLKGSVCFHGLLGSTLGSTKAKKEPNEKKLHGALLLLHGYKDPLTTQNDIENIEKEFTQAEIDWQMHIYGKAAHAFTNPAADQPEIGLMYHPKTEQRALLSMKNFFDEVFE